MFLTITKCFEMIPATKISGGYFSLVQLFYKTLIFIIYTRWAPSSYAHRGIISLIGG